MAEWLKAHAWKACVRETVPWVRIPLSPPGDWKRRLRRKRNAQSDHSGDSRKMQLGVPAANLQRFYLQRVGRADGRRFVFVSELLLRLTPKFVLSAFGPAVPLPNLVGAALDFHVGRLGHHLTF